MGARARGGNGRDGALPAATTTRLLWFVSALRSQWSAAEIIPQTFRRSPLKAMPSFSTNLPSMRSEAGFDESLGTSRSAVVKGPSSGGNRSGAELARPPISNLHTLNSAVQQPLKCVLLNFPRFPPPGPIRRHHGAACARSAQAQATTPRRLRPIAPLSLSPVQRRVQAPCATILRQSRKQI